MSVSAGSALVLGQLLLLLAAKLLTGPRAAVRVGYEMDEDLDMAVAAGPGERFVLPRLLGVVWLGWLLLLLMLAAAASAAARGLQSGSGGWERISQRGLLAAGAAATALAPAVVRPGVVERRRPYRDDTLLVLLLLLPTLLWAARIVGDPSSCAEGILLLLAAKAWLCFICLYCRAAATARLLTLLLAKGCGPADAPDRSAGAL
jgi:hypothetical protein